MRAVGVQQRYLRAAQRIAGVVAGTTARLSARVPRQIETPRVRACAPRYVSDIPSAYDHSYQVVA